MLQKLLYQRLAARFIHSVMVSDPGSLCLSGLPKVRHVPS